MIVFITYPLTPWLRSPSGAPVPAFATPTSIRIVAGASNVMICQRSTLPEKPGNLSRMFFSQNGGASMSRIHRVTVTVFPSWVTSNSASDSSSWPMLDECTNSSWVRSMRLSRMSW